MSTCDGEWRLMGAAGICSGHGSCLNDSGTVACLCDEGWSGAGDVFDMRGGGLPNGLELDCAVPLLAVRVFFALQLVGFIGRMLLVVVALMGEIRKHRRMVTRDLFTMALLFDALVSYPTVMLLIAYKVYDPASSIGTELIPTLGLALGTTLLNLGFSLYEHATFQALTRNSPDRNRLVTMHRRLSIIATISYLVLTGIPTLVALALDKSNGPIANYQFVLLILRNFGIIVWMVMRYLSVRRLEDVAERTLLNIHEGEAMKIMQFLGSNAKALRKAVIVVILIWILFSAPPLWPYQGFAMAIVTILSLPTTCHPIVLLLIQQWKKRPAADNNAVKVQHLSRDDRGNQAKPQSSVYICSQPLSESSNANNQVSSFLRERKLFVPHDTIIWHLSRKNAALASRCTALVMHPLAVLGMTCAAIVMSALETLVLIGVLEPSMGYVSFALGTLLVGTPIQYALYSFKIWKSLLTTPTVILRLIVSLVWFGNFLDVVQGDARSVIVVSSFVATLFCFTVDALVKEARDNIHRLYPMIILSALVPLRIFLLLQLDALAMRQSSKLTIALDSGNGWGWTWSTYDAARDFALLTSTMTIKDTLHNLTKRQQLRHFTGNINVKILALPKKGQDSNADGNVSAPSSNETMPLRVNRRRPTVMQNLQFKNGAMAAVADEAQERKTELCWVDTVVLREEDSIACRILGVNGMRTYLSFISHPIARFVFLAMQAVPIGVYVSLCLPGLVDANTSFILIPAFISNLRSFSLKSVKLMRLLLLRWSFAVEFISGGVVLGLFGYILQDARALFVVLLMMYWLDLRMSDARTVFWHTRTRGGDGGTEKRTTSSFFKIAYGFTGALLGCAVMALPILLSLGIVKSERKSETVQLRQDRPLAQIRLYQMVVDFVLAFAWSMLFEVFVDLTRRKNSKVVLRHLRSPVIPVFEAEASEQQEQATLMFVRNARDLNHAPTDAGSKMVSIYEDEDDDDAEENHLVSVEQARDPPHTCQ